MKYSDIIKTLLLSLLVFSVACSSDDNDIQAPSDNVANSINPVSGLTVKTTDEDLETELKWTNPTDNYLLKVEVSYELKGGKAEKASPKPLILDAISGQAQSTKLLLPEQGTFQISLVAINKAGARSGPMRASISVRKSTGEEEEEDIPVWLDRTDKMMATMTRMFLDGMPRDIWRGGYPNGGQYWDGAALVWGHGGAFSGYVATKEAFEKYAEYPEYKENCKTLYDSRLFTSVNKFITTDNNVKAYAVYPANGNDRFFDDNVWIGLDMVDLYTLTKDNQYLEKAKMVWDYLLTGTDDVMGDGVYWKEYPDKSKSKHTCSTAPTAVMAAKMYLATNDAYYLKRSKELYAWCKEKLQDPNDYLYWDNVRLNDNNELQISKDKFSYNSGQPMQAAALLYRITKEQQYLTDAQNIAKSAYNKWFIPFYSTYLNESFRILDDGHTWFQAIMFRGFVELYKLDGNRTYVDAVQKTMDHAWQSSARNSNGLFNSDFRGGTTETNWDVLHEGACLEMIARIAALKAEESAQ